MDTLSAFVHQHTLETTVNFLAVSVLQLLEYYSSRREIYIIIPYYFSGRNGVMVSKSDCHL